MAHAEVKSLSADKGDWYYCQQVMPLHKMMEEEEPTTDKDIDFIKVCRNTSIRMAGQFGVVLCDMPEGAPCCYC